jgi:hypothetical protein
MRITFVKAPLTAGTRRSWRGGWPNTVILDGAPWNEDHVRAHAAACGLLEEVARWLAEHDERP